ncbi:MAG: FG-GAP repeat domain-containing protein [Nitrospinales bacterium]
MRPKQVCRVHMISRYICVTCVILFGFISIIGSGGGGWGDDDDSWLFPLWVPTDVVVSDIDVDGRNDVLTLAMLQTSMSHKEGHLRVYRQTDQGGFSAPSTIIVGEYPWQLVVSDIDSDTLPDLLVTDPDSRNVWLLQQDPDSNGQFLPQQLIASGMRAYETAAADFNNDSTSDIAIVDSQVGSNRIVMLYQDPLHQGTFLPAVDLMLPGSSSNIAAGDLNGDGLADLLAWIYLEPSGWTPNGVLAISLQNPDGTLGPITTLAPQTGLNVGLISIADYNGDGANDLFVFFTPYSVDYKAKLTVVLQDPVSETFAAPLDTSLAGIRGINDAVVADLNGDDRPDFAVVGFFPEGSPSTVKSRLNLFIQSGGGTFSLTRVYNMPISVSSVAAGDIDDDGLNDLVVLGGENQAMVLIQSHIFKGTFNPPKPL